MATGGALGGGGLGGGGGGKSLYIATCDVEKLHNNKKK